MPESPTSLGDKIAATVKLLDELKLCTIVFVSRPSAAKELIAACEAKGLHVGDSITGGSNSGGGGGGKEASQKRNQKRGEVMEAYRKGDVQILIATDVLARGIDVPETRLVVNFDYPQDPARYQHRCGRAGRFGAPGVVLNFVSNVDEFAALGYLQRRFSFPLYEFLMDPKAGEGKAPAERTAEEKAVRPAGVVKAINKEATAAVNKLPLTKAPIAAPQRPAAQTVADLTGKLSVVPQPPQSVLDLRYAVMAARASLPRIPAEQY